VRRLARNSVRQLQALVPQSDAGVLILAYHLVGAGTEAPVDLPVADFRRHLEELRDHAEVVSLGAAVERLQSGDRCEGPVVVLTFDDAYENFHGRVYPLLVEFGFPATLYVPVDFVDGVMKGPLRGAEFLPSCTWSQLEEMVGEGLLTVGSHTLSHPDLCAVSEDRARREIQTSRHRLEIRLGRPVDSFCYPKGRWSERLEAIVGANYRSAVVGGGVRAHPSSWSAVRLPRLPLRRDMQGSILPALEQGVWLEEWIADRVRRYLR